MHCGGPRGHECLFRISDFVLCIVFLPGLVEPLRVLRQGGGFMGKLMATAIAHVAGISTRQKLEYIEKTALNSSKRFVINKPYIMTC
jgi:hypothetical protein